VQNNRINGSLFAESAQDFCKLVEQIDGHLSEHWLKAVGKIILRLDTDITYLTASAPQSTHVWISDLDKRFELYSRLKDFLGDRDEYWSEADLHAADGYMTGSLSDDFADIYFELKRGLQLLAQGQEGRAEAIKLWTSGYREHWRQHLVDARKQLFEFGAHASKTQPKTLICQPPKKPV
jgi:hypothetical protein